MAEERQRCSDQKLEERCSEAKEGTPPTTVTVTVTVIVTVTAARGWFSGRTGDLKPAGVSSVHLSTTLQATAGHPSSAEVV